MQGLTTNTAKLFPKISELECIKPYVLVGGTALALQINHRKSEDLDFMQWQDSKNQKKEVEWYKIQKELSNIGEITQQDIFGLEHVEFVVNGVKISFYIADRKQPEINPIKLVNNITLADIEAIGTMKMEILLRRSKFRDYYDIYSILKEGKDFNTMMTNALKHSSHNLKSKNLIAMLTDSSRFSKDENFAQLEPKYNISAQEIELYIRDIILKTR